MDLTTIPIDILYAVLAHCDYLEILHLRLVSKRLSAASRSHAVLLGVYRRSSLLLPLGPFGWSTEEMEETLARSLRLELNWNPATPTGVPQPVTERAIQDRTFRGIMSISVILERYLLVGASQSLRCYDLQTNQMLAALTGADGAITTKFASAYYSDAQGHSTAHVLIATVSQTLRILRFNMEPSQPVSFEAVAELESIVPNPIPVLEVNDRYILVGAPQQCRLLDTNTFAVSTIPQSMQKRNTQTSAFLGSTHVVLIDVDGHSSFFHAFPLPSISLPDLPSELEETHFGSKSTVYREITYLSTSIDVDSHGHATTNMDFVALNNNTELWHIRINIDPRRSSLRISSTLVCNPLSYIWNLTLTSHRGVGRGVCFGASTGTPQPKLMGFTFDTINHTGRFVELKSLGFEEMGTLVYGGVTGRLCLSNSQRHGEVGILEYV